MYDWTFLFFETRLLHYEGCCVVMCRVLLHYYRGKGAHSAQGHSLNPLSKRQQLINTSPPRWSLTRALPLPIGTSFRSFCTETRGAEVSDSRDGTFLKSQQPLKTPRPRFHLDFLGYYPQAAVHPTDWERKITKDLDLKALLNMNIETYQDSSDFKRKVMSDPAWTGLARLGSKHADDVWKDFRQYIPPRIPPRIHIFGYQLPEKWAERLEKWHLATISPYGEPEPPPIREKPFKRVFILHCSYDSFG